MSQLKDTVDDEEAEVPEQQNSQDEGRAVQNVSRAFLLLNAPAAPGGAQNQSGSSYWKHLLRQETLREEHFWEKLQVMFIITEWIQPVVVISVSLFTVAFRSTYRTTETSASSLILKSPTPPTLEHTSHRSASAAGIGGTLYLLGFTLLLSVYTEAQVLYFASRHKSEPLSVLFVLH